MVAKSVLLGRVPRARLLKVYVFDRLNKRHGSKGVFF